jgi:molybdopterin converting factor small subunit
MNIRVLFFGATADATGTKKIELDVEEGTNALSVFESVIDQFPQLHSHTLRFAVNEQYANGSEVVRDGDILAVFTAVSGG